MQQQMLCGDEVHSVVADLGSSVSKFGSAGQDLPRYLLKSHVGEILDSTAPGGKRFVFSDTGLRALRDDMAVRSLSAASPVKWEHVERLMQFSIGSYMRLSTAEVPILFADNIITGAVGTATAQGSAMAAAAAPVPGSSASEKQKLMQMCFESLHSPAIYSISSGVLSAFSTGRTSALVIDIGAAGTRIMPVVDGYELRRCSVFTRRGGNWLDDILLREMNAQLRKTYPGITAPPLPTAGAMKGKATTAAAAIAMNKQYAAAAASGAGMRLFDVNNSVVRPWFEAKPAASSATTTAAAAAVRRPVQPTFREFHIRGVVQDLKEWMCFVPYAPIALPEHLLQPKPVSQPAPPPGKSTASAAAAAAAAVTSATMSVMQQHADAVSEYRVQELQNRSLQFPPPYELPDGHHVVATDRICTAPEQMFFTAPLPEPVVIMQPPKVPRSKSKTASNAAAQAAAAQAAVNAQAAAQAAAVAAASKKRARVILEEQTANAAAAVDALISAGAVGADGITGASSSVENTSSKVSSSSGSSSSSGRLRAGGAGISISSSVGALSNVKVDEESLSDLVFLCVSQCDVDVRRELLGNIHIVGGGSRIDGIAQRLAYELTEIVPSHIKVKVVSALPAERHYAPWIGGSILSMCGTFQQLWLTRAEYEEQGPERCVQRFDH